MRDYADTWTARGVRAGDEGWWEMADTVDDKICALVGVGPGEISLHQNVTLTQAMIASCFDAREVKFELLARDILVDYRPAAGIRLSPHFYNRGEEIDFALSQIEEILATDAWKRHLPAAKATGA